MISIDWITRRRKKRFPSTSNSTLTLTSTEEEEGDTNTRHTDVCHTSDPVSLSLFLLLYLRLQPDCFKGKVGRMKERKEWDWLCEVLARVSLVSMNKKWWWRRLCSWRQPSLQEAFSFFFFLFLQVSFLLFPSLSSSKFSSESVGSCFVTFSTFLYILMLVPWLFFGCVKAFPSTSNHGTQVKRKRERKADIRGRRDG